jgi:hypothetical protein
VESAECSFQVRVTAVGVGGDWRWVGGITGLVGRHNLEVRAVSAQVKEEKAAVDARERRVG